MLTENTSQIKGNTTNKWQQKNENSKYKFWPQENMYKEKMHISNKANNRQRVGTLRQLKTYVDKEVHNFYHEPNR